MTVQTKACLLDTNIVIYTMQRVAYAELYRSILLKSIPVISFITVAELLEGAYRAGVGTRPHQRIIEEIIKYAVIPYNEAICDCFGKIRAERRNRPISVTDAFIAATAMVYGLPLVTHNAKDFVGITGLSLITAS